MARSRTRRARTSPSPAATSRGFRASRMPHDDGGCRPHACDFWHVHANGGNELGSRHADGVFSRTQRRYAFGHGHRQWTGDRRKRQHACAGSVANPLGTLTVTSALTFNAGSAFNVTLAPSGQNSAVNAAGQDGDDQRRHRAGDLSGRRLHHAAVHSYLGQCGRHLRSAREHGPPGGLCVRACSSRQVT